MSNNQNIIQRIEDIRKELGMSNSGSPQGGGVRDLTQQILNKLISTSTGDINGKIVDLYDKMNSVYNDLSNSSTNYTKGKIVDIYTKFNNIYNELNSTSTSYMKGKINSIYSKIITDGDEEKFVPNFNCNRLVATSRDENVYYPNPPIADYNTVLKCILNFNPPKTALYRIVSTTNNVINELGDVEYRYHGRLHILNGLNFKDYTDTDGYTYLNNSGFRRGDDYYTNVKYDIEKQNFLKDIKHNELIVEYNLHRNDMGYHINNYRYHFTSENSPFNSSMKFITDIYKKNNYNFYEKRSCAFFQENFGSVYRNYKRDNEEIYMKLYKGLNLVIAKCMPLSSNYGEYGSVVKVYTS